MPKRKKTLKKRRQRNKMTAEEKEIANRNDKERMELVRKKKREENEKVYMRAQRDIKRSNCTTKTDDALTNQRANDSRSKRKLHCQESPKKRPE